MGKLEKHPTVTPEQVMASIRLMKKKDRDTLIAQIQNHYPVKWQLTAHAPVEEESEPTKEEILKDLRRSLDEYTAGKLKTRPIEEFLREL